MEDQQTEFPQMSHYDFNQDLRCENITVIQLLLLLTAFGKTVNSASFDSFLSLPRHTKKPRGDGSQIIKEMYEVYSWLWQCSIGGGWQIRSGNSVGLEPLALDNKLTHNRQTTGWWGEESPDGKRGHTHGPACWWICNPSIWSHEDWEKAWLLGQPGLHKTLSQKGKRGNLKILQKHLPQKAYWRKKTEENKW